MKPKLKNFRIDASQTGNDLKTTLLEDFAGADDHFAKICNSELSASAVDHVVKNLGVENWDVVLEHGACSEIHGLVAEGVMLRTCEHVLKHVRYSSEGRFAPVRTCAESISEGGVREGSCCYGSGIHICGTVLVDLAIIAGQDEDDIGPTHCCDKRRHADSGGGARTEITEHGDVVRSVITWSCGGKKFVRAGSLLCGTALPSFHVYKRCAAIPAQIRSTRMIANAGLQLHKENAKRARAQAPSLAAILRHDITAKPRAPRLMDVQLHREQKQVTLEARARSGCYIME